MCVERNLYFLRINILKARTTVTSVSEIQEIPFFPKSFKKYARLKEKEKRYASETIRPMKNANLFLYCAWTGTRRRNTFNNDCHYRVFAFLPHLRGNNHVIRTVKRRLTHMLFTDMSPAIDCKLRWRLWKWSTGLAHTYVLFVSKYLQLLEITTNENSA